TPTVLVDVRKRVLVVLNDARRVEGAARGVVLIDVRASMEVLASLADRRLVVHAALLDPGVTEPAALIDERVVGHTAARREAVGVLDDRRGHIVVQLVEHRLVVVSGLRDAGDGVVAVLVELVVGAGALEHRRVVTRAVLDDSSRRVIGALAEVRQVARTVLLDPADRVGIALLVRGRRRRATLVEIGIVARTGLDDRAAVAFA